MAVTSPGKSMVAAASKGRGIGRGNFYTSLDRCMLITLIAHFCLQHVDVTQMVRHGRNLSGARGTKPPMSQDGSKNLVQC